jgi:acyl carrier protein
MKEKIVSIIKELQPTVEIKEDSLDIPLDDFGLDSLDVMEIIMKVETDFEIDMDDCDLSKANSINDLIKAVNDKQQV